MTVDLQSITEQIRGFGDQIRKREKERQNRIQTALDLFQKYSDDIPFLQKRVEQIIAANRGTRCAKPDCHALNSKFICQHDENNKFTVLASDGSQILPDRHRRVEFDMINISVIKLDKNRRITKPVKISKLLLPDISLSPDERITEDIISLERNTKERQLLCEIGCTETPQVIALSDGPLELFREPQEERLHQTLFKQYAEALKTFTDMGGIFAGYVDRPKADLMIRLLELASLEEADIKKASQLRPLYGVTDTDLFMTILQPGERSGVFLLESNSANHFKTIDERLALSFFYINIGTNSQGNQTLVRVEIPAVISNQSCLMDKLHQTIIEQCKKMGSRPYPYLLHRAHEEALVTFQESTYIEDLLVSSLFSNDTNSRQTSNKQFAKMMSGKRQKYQG